MTSIDPSQSLAALLRNEISALRGRVATARPIGNTAPAQRTNADAAGAAAARIQALSPDDPDRKQKALRIFLESVLLQEFGAHLLQDPSFSRMVDAVQVRMQSDSEMAAAADQLGDVLLSGAFRK